MPTTKPQGVVPSDPNVRLFGNIVKEAYARLGSTLTEADYSTPTRRAEILRQVKQMVDESDEATQAWVRLNVGGFYELGLWESAKDLNERGSNVRFDAKFAHFHKEALEAIAQDTYSSIASGMQGLNNTAERMVSMGAREQVLVKIGRGQITGEANKSIQKQITQELKKAGITGLRDRRGVEWDLDRYAEMLVRTKLTQAHNTGVANRMIESGYDLVVVSNHRGACKLCGPWEGKILSLTGRNPSHISLDMAKQGGLFHPNCRHVYSPYQNKYLDNAVAWDTEKQQYRPYQQVRAEVIKRNEEKIKGAISKMTYDEAFSNFNQLAKTLTVYRGTGKQTPAHDFDSYGKGKYYSFSKDYAEKFGNVTESEVTVKNPLEIRSQSDLDKITKQMIADEYKDLAEWAKAKGHDAIIDYNTETINVLLK